MFNSSCLNVDDLLSIFVDDLHPFNFDSADALYSVALKAFLMIFAVGRWKYIAQHFSIANICKKKRLTKEHEIKQVRKKKEREAKLDRTEKNQILNCS